MRTPCLRVCTGAVATHTVTIDDITSKCASMHVSAPCCDNEVKRLRDSLLSVEAKYREARAELAAANAHLAILSFELRRSEAGDTSSPARSSMESHESTHDPSSLADGSQNLPPLLTPGSRGKPEAELGTPPRHAVPACGTPYDAGAPGGLDWAQQCLHSTAADKTGKDLEVLVAEVFRCEVTTARSGSSHASPASPRLRCHRTQQLAHSHLGFTNRIRDHSLLIRNPSLLPPRLA